MKKSVYLSLAVAVLLCIVGWTSYGQSRSSARAAWEYKSVWSGQQGFRGDETLNELGAQGWELASAAATETQGTGYTFKRLK